MILVYIPANDSFMFVIGNDVNTAKPYRMIGSPMFFSSLRDAAEAAAFIGLAVHPDGRVLSQTGPDGLYSARF
jgi:hypothetical protein